MTAQPAPIRLADLLPPRAIAVRPPRSVEGGTVGAIAMLLLILGGLGAWLGPGIAGDWRMRHDWISAPDARITAQQCHAWATVLSTCSVTVADAKHGGERTQWYVFAGGARDRATEPRRSRSDAAQITTDLGLESLTSRLVTLLAFASIIVFCLVVAAAMLWKGMKMQRAFAAMSGQRLLPVVVEIERSNRLPPRRRLWVYLYETESTQERALVEWPVSRHPLFTSADERWALALRSEEGGTPMLLDTRLEGLDLTEAEKAAFRQAFLAAFGERADAVAAV
ncbi:MAG: hypothetical protein K2X43_07215 [Hyphomonadaceae bacterium]|nr:hypothetical protein [Hyphomonadaceae bacterium]